MAKRNEKIAALVALLENNPGAVDKLIGLLTNPQLAKAAAEGNDSEIDPQMLESITKGKIEFEKGPTLHGVFQGISVCGTCGKEKRTYSTNKNGLVTQHICSQCETKMAFMTEEQRVDFFKRGMMNDYLSIAETKFRIIQERFMRNRKLEADKYKQIGRDIKRSTNKSVSVDNSGPEDMPQIPFNVNPKGLIHDKDKQEVDQKED